MDTEGAKAERWYPGPLRSSKDMTVGIKIENGSCDPDHAPLGVFVIHMVYRCIKFDDPSFSHSRDITGCPKI